MRFQQIYGHKKPLAILKSAMAANRVAHAYLFYGKEGVGKKTVASVFARALNCPAAAPPCDVCPSCLKAEHKNHPNIIEIVAEGQFIKIAAVREIMATMAFRPEDGKRVFILQDADKMNAPAANALLKTLEEPSADNVLILTSARPHALPVTILSRCQALRFAPLQKTEVASFLREQQGFGEAEAEAIAAASLGSIGDALEMKKEDYMTVRNGILKRLAEDDPADLIRRLAFARRLGTEREEITQRLQIMQNAYRDSLILKETGESEMLLFKDWEAAISALAARLSGREILKNMAVVGRAMDAISRNSNKTLTLEAMLVRLA
ncbi:MAG: DNA polymerase III subunit delta' [Syntrophobacterales bacterium]|nr:DNA polymerase III subunit delta' [Syntrophobacterales bacterium]